MGPLSKWLMTMALLLLFNTQTGFAQEGAAAPTKKAATKTATSQKSNAPEKEKINSHKSHTPNAPPPTVEAPTASESEALTEPLDVITENTLEMCQDAEDNDADSHVDCDDQDCEIFAICIAEEAPPEEEVTASLPQTVRVPVQFPLTEQGLQCRDGVDNNENGLIDCHDPTCQPSYYCRRVMYERPAPPNKIPGLFINTGVGIALPNYRLPTGETKWPDPNTEDVYKVPFDPDMGTMIDLQVGYLFMKYIGVGLSLKSAFTFATNRILFFLSKDDPDFYKYNGSKYYGNVSGFFRVQWPAGIVVPHLSFHVGYSVSQFTWRIYDRLNPWSDIDDYEVDDSEYIIGDQTEIRSGRKRHFTFALEPGVDFFVVKRLFGIGIKAWLPVIASANPEADNVGVLLNLTFTPTWREPLQLKPEYK